MSMLAESRNGADVPDAPHLSPGRVRVTGEAASIHSGAGAHNAILTVVARGTELPLTAQSGDGWFAVRLAGGEGWISGECAERVEA